MSVHMSLHVSTHASVHMSVHMSVHRPEQFQLHKWLFLAELPIGTGDTESNTLGSIKKISL